MILTTTLSLPDVNHTIANHSSITAGWASTERMYVIDEKLSSKRDYKPWLVIRNYRAGTMKSFDIKTHSLGARWSINHLKTEGG